MSPVANRPVDPADVLLFAEDDPGYREAVRDSLRADWPGKFAEATSFLELRDIVENHAERIRIAVLDRRLVSSDPSLDAKVESIAEALSKSGVKVVMYTAFDPDPDASESLAKSGVKVILKKGPWYDELSETMEQFREQGFGGREVPIEPPEREKDPHEGRKVERVLMDELRHRFLAFVEGFEAPDASGFMWAGREYSLKKVVKEVRSRSRVGNEIMAAFFDATQIPLPGGDRDERSQD